MVVSVLCDLFVNLHQHPYGRANCRLHISFCSVDAEVSYCLLSVVYCAEMAGCAGICWSLVWLLLLLIGGWPIGGLCAGFYLLLSPFGACIEALTPLINLLEQGLKLPLTCALNMVHQKALCWRAVARHTNWLTNEFQLLRHCSTAVGISVHVSARCTTRDACAPYHMNLWSSRVGHHCQSTFSELVWPQNAKLLWQARTDYNGWLI